MHAQVSKPLYSGLSYGHGYGWGGYGSGSYGGYGSYGHGW